jgi:hypothetical protein
VALLAVSIYMLACKVELCLVMIVGVYLLIDKPPLLAVTGAATDLKIVAVRVIKSPDQ